MRIWFINHYTSTPDQPTTGAYSLMKQLAARGHDVTAFTSSFSYYARKELRLKRFRLTRLEQDIQAENLKFQWIRTTSTSGRAVTRLINMLSFMLFSLIVGTFKKEKPDIIVGVAPHPFGVFAAWLLSVRHGAKFVYEIRDIWPESLIESGMLKESSALANLIFSMQRLLYSRANLITSVLPKMDDYIRSLGLKKTFCWIPNGVEIPEMPLLPRAKNPVFTFMYLGGHSKYQGIDTILQAGQRLQNQNVVARIVLVGDGSEKPRLKKMAHDMNISNIIFRDAVPRSDVMKVAAEADAFIFHLKHMPILKFGMSPNKLCDYMLAGKPIVCAVNAPHNPVREADAGICIPSEDVDAMAIAMKDILAMNDTMRAQLGENGLNYVHQNLNSNVIAAKLEDALLKIQSGRA